MPQISIPLSKIEVPNLNIIVLFFTIDYVEIIVPLKSENFK